MTKNILLLSLGLLFVTGCAAQTVKTNNTASTTGTTATSTRDTLPAAISQFIPPHYKVLMHEEGDITGDKIPDLALVLKPEDEDKQDADTSANNFPPRLLLVLADVRGRGYEQIGYSDSAIWCKDCGGVFGDPLDGIGIEDGVLTISHYGGSRLRWGWLHKFRWQNGGLYLIGKTSYALDDVLLTDETKDYNLVTGDFEDSWTVPDNYKNNPDFSDSDIEQIALNDKPTVHKKLKVKPLVKFEDFDIDDNKE